MRIVEDTVAVAHATKNEKMQNTLDINNRLVEEYCEKHSGVLPN